MPKSAVVLLAWALVSIGLLAGCSDRSGYSDLPAELDAVTQPAMRAESVLQQALARYRAADRYCDQAVLLLEYRLDGRPMREQHRWCVALDRGRLLAADLFAARVRGDAQHTLAYIYDLPSQNLDGQVMVVEGDGSGTLPLARLFDDPVFLHFSAGHSELPVIESLIPPTLGLLAGAPLEFLANPDSVQFHSLRLEKIDGHPCHRLEIRSAGRLYDVWIDAVQFAVRQLSYPKSYLAAAVSESPSIRDLALVARFTSATFDPPAFSSLDSHRGRDAHGIAWTANRPRENARRVRAFVPVPEPFPSDWIGRPLPADAVQSVTDAAGRPRNLGGQTPHRDGGAQPFGPSAQVLLFCSWELLAMAVELADSLDEHVVPTLPLDASSDTWAGSTDSPRFALSIVVGVPGHPDTGAHLMAAALRESNFIRNDGLELAVDWNFQLLQRLGLRQLPCAVVLDAGGRIHFVQSLQPETAGNRNAIEEVAVAAQRVARGQDVAAEMRRQYAEFVRRYQQLLDEQKLE